MSFFKEIKTNNLTKKKKKQFIISNNFIELSLSRITNTIYNMHVIF